MTASSRPTYGNWRTPRSAGLWNLGLAGTALLLASLAVIVVTATSAGLLPALTEGAVLAVVLGLMSVRDRHALTAGQRLTARLAYARGR